MTTPSSTSASTSASTLAPLLPLNLYHLSPTIQKWCALRCADIASLNTRGVYYENKLIHHYLNHPIRYIKLIGLVVSIDDFARRRVYTIDDSSGVCIECVALLPPPPSNPSSSNPNLPTPETPAPSEPSITHPQIHWDTISECKIVRILGVMGTYMTMPQLQIVKMGAVESTDVERKWWDECSGLKDPSVGILGRDWVLSEEEVERWKRRERRRKARKVETGRQREREGQGQGKKRTSNRGGNRLKDGSGRKKNTDSSQEERKKQQEEKKGKDNPHHLTPTIAAKPPSETSSNKTKPKPPTTKERILPIALSDLSKYDTFGL